MEKPNETGPKDIRNEETLSTSLQIDYPILSKVNAIEKLNSVQDLGKIKQYDLIILVIAHHDPLYDYFYSVWRRYDRTHPRIKVFYVYAQTNVVNEINDRGLCWVEDEHIIRTNIVESYLPGILLKTVRAFEFIEERYEYKYLLRSNLSSFFRFDKLYEYIMCRPSTNLFEGSTGDGFVSGTGIMMSRDIIRLLIKNKHHLNYGVIDDVAIGHFMTKFNIPMISTYNRYCMLAPSSKIPEKVLATLPYFHFRIRHPKKRMIFDRIVLERLYKLFYELPS